jgi:hypothetical protein
MFGVTCDHLGRTVLRHMSDVTGIENCENGIQMFYTCWCGLPGVITTGSGVSREHSGHVQL